MNKTGLKQTMRDFGEWMYDTGVFVGDVASEMNKNRNRKEMGRAIGTWYVDDYTPWAKDTGSFAYDVGVDTGRNIDRTVRWIGDKAYNAYEATGNVLNTAGNTISNGYNSTINTLGSVYYHLFH
ncbi:MAG: hypothetical protein B6242_04945 [Anaerolineaceae bacterium 4572_78]|nr:MAG: hypothetical protein B6242_04945 [Anaerolineaceae bacterium 4572_78]